MDFLKKVNALVLGLAVLLAAGCGDDEKGSPSPGNATQANCKLTKHTTSLSATEYIYDNAGKLVRVNHTSSVSPESNSYELITYDADGNITAVKNMVHGYSKVLSYNSNNQPDTIYHFNGSVKSGFITCGYNTANQLIKWSSFSAHETVSSNYFEISYPAPNKSIELKYQRNAAGAPVLESTAEYLYDDKWHPYYQLGYFYEALIFSKHNVLSSTMTYPGQSYINKQTYSYEYNAAGYPVKQSTVQNGGSPTIDNYSYNCQ